MELCLNVVIHRLTLGGNFERDSVLQRKISFEQIVFFKAIWIVSTEMCERTYVERQLIHLQCTN